MLEVGHFLAIECTMKHRYYDSPNRLDRGSRRGPEAFRLPFPATARTPEQPRRTCPRYPEGRASSTTTICSPWGRTWHTHIHANGACPGAGHPADCSGV